MMMKIRNLAGIVFFSAKRVADYMMIKWDFRATGKRHNEHQSPKSTDTARERIRK